MNLFIIDEIQRLPFILNEVHRLIESEGLKFIPCGSSNFKIKDLKVMEQFRKIYKPIVTNEKLPLSLLC